MSRNISGCPLPKPITLKARLAPFVGKIVTVVTPGLIRTTGVLSNNSTSGFTVGALRVPFATSFYILLPVRGRPLLPFNVNARAEDLGEIGGQLVQVGRNFVELIQSRGSVSTLFPLNLFTEVQCEPMGDE